MDSNYLSLFYMDAITYPFPKHYLQNLNDQFMYKYKILEMQTVSNTLYRNIMIT